MNNCNSGNSMCDVIKGLCTHGGHAEINASNNYSTRKPEPNGCFNESCAASGATIKPALLIL